MALKVSYKRVFSGPEEWEKQEIVSKSTYRQWLACGVIFTVAFLYGCKVSWITATISSFLSEEFPPIQATENDISWLASVSFTSSIFSVLICFTITEKFGRKQILVSCTFFYVVAWTVILFTSSIKTVIICFWLYGIASGTQYIIACVYIGEIGSPKNRELLGIAGGLAYAIGTELEYLISLLGSYRCLALFPLFVSLFGLYLSSYMIESPYYLIGRKNNEQALRNLRYLNDNMEEKELMANLDTIKKYVDEQNGLRIEPSTLKIILAPANLKLILIMIVINGLSTINCENLVSVTGSLLLKDFKNSLNGTSFVNTVNTLRIFLMFGSCFTVRKFNRRSLLLVGYPIVGLLQAICGIFYYSESLHGNSIDWMANMIACLLIGVLICSSLTFSFALELLKIEIFPHKLKEFYSSLLLFTCDLFIFALVKSYFYLKPIFGNAFLMITYAMISFLTVGIIYPFIQDTKGKTLLQIRTDINEEFRSLIEQSEDI